MCRKSTKQAEFAELRIAMFKYRNQAKNSHFLVASQCLKDNRAKNWQFLSKRLSLEIEAIRLQKYWLLETPSFIIYARI